jgi:predicted TIM-barrel fold metal-dependent hydrolase
MLVNADFVVDADPHWSEPADPRDLGAPDLANRSNLYATFWFENNRNKLPELVEAVGEDSILFETDVPHPTCMYPHPLDTVAEKVATLSPEARRKIMGENARKLYRL